MGRKRVCYPVRMEGRVASPLCDSPRIQPEMSDDKAKVTCRNCTAILMKGR